MGNCCIREISPLPHGFERLHVENVLDWGEGAADSRRQPLSGGDRSADYFCGKYCKSFSTRFTLSCRARSHGLAFPACARTPQGALRFPSRNIDPARMRNRKTGTSESAGATAPAGAADTWTRPILRAQCARRILCSGSKDTCTWQTSQNIQISSGDWRRRSRRRERNQTGAGLSESNNCAGPTLRFRKFYSIQWKP
jgi:hypothetical protein